jgi:hypothetical protein
METPMDYVFLGENFPTFQPVYTLLKQAHKEGP